MISDSSITNQDSQKNEIDLVLFMGQSNMAGRGTANKSPVVPTGCGYEFRSISDPTKLYNIIEPFGLNENNKEGINEPGMKTGSLVSSFINAYYDSTKVPIVGISASKGGSSINEWQPAGNYLTDAIARLNRAKEFLLQKEYLIRKTFMVWCQGETDGDNHMSGEEYKTKLSSMLETLLNNHVENCFMIRIGNNRDNETLYNNIKKAQTEFCQTNERVILVSTQFEKMANRKLMKDPFHYEQEAYNTVGAEAGTNTAFYIINKEKPIL